MSSPLKLSQVTNPTKPIFSYRQCSARQLQVSILHHMCNRSSAAAQLQKVKPQRTTARTKRPCNSSCKLRLHRSRPQLPKLKSASELIRMPAGKRKRRQIRDVKKKRCSEYRKRNLRGRGKKMLKQTSSANSNNSRRGCKNSSATNS